MVFVVLFVIFSSLAFVKGCSRIRLFVSITECHLINFGGTLFSFADNPYWFPILICPFSLNLWCKLISKIVRPRKTLKFLLGIPQYNITLIWSNYFKVEVKVCISVLVKYYFIETSSFELMCEHFYILQYNDTNGTYNRTPAGYVIMIHFILKQFLCPLNRTNLANSFCSCDQNTWWISTCLFNKKKDTLDIICAFVLYLRAKIILETEQI